MINKNGIPLSFGGILLSNQATTKFNIGDLVTTTSFGGVTGRVFMIEVRSHTTFYAVEGCSQYIHEDLLTFIRKTADLI